MEENGATFIEGMLCAGGNKKGSCQVKGKKRQTGLDQISQGDSGGALTVDGVLAGLVSRGGSDSCAKVTSSFLILTFIGHCV